ncbi:MAG TPA: hypothetical protein VKZ56_07505 [Membranihabitans sp.]|nr:hypothetical protein [Membranihabitans sp.]
MHFDNGEDFQMVIEGIIENRYNLEDIGVHFKSMERVLNEIPADTLEVMDKNMVEDKFSSILTISQEGNEKYIRPVVDSRTLRTLVNSEGNLAIGDTVYHFTYDKTYAMALSKFTTSDQIQSGADRIYEVIRKSGNNTGVRGVIDCIDYYGGEKRKQQRRMKGELWDYNNTVYQEISVGVENFDKNLAHIWKKDDATNIWLEGHFEVQYYDSYQGWVNIADDLDEYRFHESDIEVIIISRYLDGNSLGNVTWDGTDMLFKANEVDDSEVRHDGTWDQAQCTIIE